MSGKGKVTQTGSLGEVMQESITAAITVVRSRAASLGIDNFLLNESIEFTRNTLSNPQGLAMTGLKDAYDTGLLGPMASILDELEMGQRDNLNNGYSPFGGFNNF